MIKRHNSKNWSRTTTFASMTLFLLICKIGVLETGYSAENDQKNPMAVFYERLESIVDDSSYVQISRLKKFIEDFPEFARSYHRLYEIYILEGQIKEAKRFFSNSATIKQFARNSQWMLAKIYSHENDPNAVLRAYISALQAGPASSDLIKDFLVFDNQHSAKFNNPSFVEKLSLNEKEKKIANAFVSFLKLDFHETIKKFSELPESWHDLTTLYAWGYCHRRLAQNKQAGTLWKKALALSRQIKDRQLEAKLLMVLGNLLMRTESNQSALCYYDSSYSVTSKIGDLSNIVHLAGNRALIHQESGNHIQAENLFREAISISKKLKSNRRLAVWLGYFGVLLKDMDRYDEALRALDESAGLAKKINDEQVLIRSLYEKGTLYHKIGQTELARTTLNEALNLAKERRLIDLEHRAAVGIADIHFKEGRLKQARKTYNEYIHSSLFKAGYWGFRSYWLIKRGQTFVADKKFALAREDFQEAFETAKKAGSDNNRIWALIHHADLDFLLNNIAEASQKYSTCLEFALAKQDSSTLPAVYLGLGNVRNKSGELNKAISYYRIAADIIEKTRANLKVEEIRIGYFVDASQVYDKLIDCYYQLYDNEREKSYLDSLYFFVEMTHGRALRDLKIQKDLEIPEKRNDKQVIAYFQVCEQLRKKQRYLRKNADNLSSAEYDTLLSEIQIARLSLIAQRLRLTADQNPDLPEHSLSQTIKNLKKRNLGLLLYHIAEKRSFALAVADNEVKFVPLKLTGSNLTSAIKTLMTPFHTLTDESVEEIPFKADMAYRLYEMLIKPVEDVFTLPQNLLVVPDTELMNLPFEILLTIAPDKPEYTPFDEPTYAQHFLLQRHTIVYSPTTTLFDDGSKWAFSQPDVLIFANPFGVPLLTQSNSSSVQTQRKTMRLSALGTVWHPLPFAEVEATKIKDLVSSTKIYRQSTATKTAFFKEAKNFAVLHLATHGFVDTTYDAFSGLVLALSENVIDDGMLMGYEISDLNLNKCDLITLSACETGRGKLVKGEGVLGLPRLFLSVGAKSVLMTLWKVDDLFTSQFMPAFYNFYLNKNLSKANALTKAKRMILNKKIDDSNQVYYQHPFFWASFTLFGDPGQDKVNLSRMKTIFLIVMVVLLGLTIWFAYLRRQKNPVLTQLQS